MALGFFLSTLTMMLVAFSFAASPFLAQAKRYSAGFARWPLLIVLACIGLAVALYGAVGQPGLASQAKAAGAAPHAPARAAAANSSSSDSKAGSVESLLGGLEQRLADNPDDGKGWLLLARSYDHLGRRDAARDAYEKAAALGAADAGLEVKFRGAHADDSAAEGAVIRGTVRLADEASNLVGENETVFITAKSVNGSPMPLAVLRRSADDIPFDFTLDNSNSMMSGPALQNGQKVIVSAKISKTGDALLTNHELSAVTEPIDPADDTLVELVIGTDTADQ